MFADLALLSFVNLRRKCTCKSCMKRVMSLVPIFAYTAYAVHVNIENMLFVPEIFVSINYLIVIENVSMIK